MSCGALNCKQCSLECLVLRRYTAAAKSKVLSGGHLGIELHMSAEAPKRPRSGQEGPWGSPQKKARSGGRSAGAWRDPAASIDTALPQAADSGGASHASHASASSAERAARAPAAFQTQQSASLSTGGTQEPVKKRRGRPPKPGGPTLAPPKPNIPRTGAPLMQHIAEVTESSNPQCVPAPAAHAPHP